MRSYSLLRTLRSKLIFSTLDHTHQQFCSAIRRTFHLATIAKKVFSWSKRKWLKIFLLDLKANILSAWLFSSDRVSDSVGCRMMVSWSELTRPIFCRHVPVTLCLKQWSVQHWPQDGRGDCSWTTSCRTSQGRRGPCWRRCSGWGGGGGTEPHHWSVRILHQARSFWRHSCSWRGSGEDWWSPQLSQYPWVPCLWNWSTLWDRDGGNNQEAKEGRQREDNLDQPEKRTNCLHQWFPLRRQVWKLDSHWSESLLSWFWLAGILRISMRTFRWHPMMTRPECWANILPELSVRGPRRQRIRASRSTLTKSTMTTLWTEWTLRSLSWSRRSRTLTPFTRNASKTVEWTYRSPGWNWEYLDKIKSDVSGLQNPHDGGPDAWWRMFWHDCQHS